jgi:uncharacterized membrane protein
MNEKNEESKEKETDSFDGELKKDAINVGGSVIGAIVGLALGGPAGAVIGATTAPAIGMTYNLINRAVERRRERTKKVLENAFVSANVSPEKAVELLNSDDAKTDDFLSLLRIISQSDPSLDSILSVLLGETLKTKSNQERERLLILGDAIKNLRATHLSILKAIFDAGGTLKSNEIAIQVGIPEIELRSVVRDLELRGMIKDIGNHPVEWKLRELGTTLINFANSKNNNV